MNYGLVRIAVGIPNVKVGDCKYNAQEIESLIAQAEGKGVEIICFPELSVTSYTCGDLFSQQYWNSSVIPPQHLLKRASHIFPL